MSAYLSLENILDIAKKASREGAEVLRSYFGNLNGAIQTKPDLSVVSEADRESERVIREILVSHFPQFSIFGEEGGLVHSVQKTEGTWYLDPLDGTTNFVHGFPYFSTSIGLEVNGEIVVAVVDAPFLNLSFWASRGGGAFKNGQRLYVQNREKLDECLLATGFSYEIVQGREKQLQIFSHLLGKSRGIRRPGAAALDLCFTAAGVFDGFWEKYLKPWDMAAGSLIIEEAGGVVTSLEGEKWSPNVISILAGSPNIHAILKKEISSQL